jgi:hypothetical protein
LNINTQRLITSYGKIIHTHKDIYKTLRFIASDFQDLTYNFDTDHDDYGLNFINDEIPFSRDCHDANIPFYVCTCNKKLKDVPNGWRECGSGSDEQNCD